MIIALRIALDIPGFERSRRIADALILRRLECAIM